MFLVALAHATECFAKYRYAGLGDMAYVRLVQPHDSLNGLRAMWHRAAGYTAYGEDILGLVQAVV